MDLANFKQDVHKTYDRIRKNLIRTRLLYCPYLSDLSDSAKVYLKLENLQNSNSFKIRGALSKLSLLAHDAVTREKGVITASSGNHGLSCGFVGQQYGIKVRSFACKTASKDKKDALERGGVEVVLWGDDCLEAEKKARQTAKEEGLVYVSPYNDSTVMMGQATVGLEIYEDLQDVDAVLMCVGGGGLAGGVAAYLKACNPDIKVYGCQPEQSKVMYESVRAGHIIFEPSGETLSDGSAGGVEEDSITFILCRDYVDDWLIVSEEQIARAIFFLLDKQKMVIEGAAGVAVAAFMNNTEKFKNQTVAIVICGGVVSVKTLKFIIDKYV